MTAKRHSADFFINVIGALAPFTASLATLSASMRGVESARYDKFWLFGSKPAQLGALISFDWPWLSPRPLQAHQLTNFRGFPGRSAAFSNTKFLLSFSVVSLAGLAPARAQLIQTSFPSDIPGYPPNLSSSVINRMLLQDEDQGIEYDAFLFRPSVSESGGYNSSTLGQPGTASAEEDTAASLRVNSDWPRDALGVSLAVNNQRYFEEPVANTTTWSAGIGGALDVGHDTATLSYAHSVQYLTATDLGVAGVVAPVPYAVDDVRISYLKLFSRFSLQPSYEFQNYQFGAAAQPVPENDNGLNHTIESGALDGRYEFSPGNAAVVIGQVSRAHFPLSSGSNYTDEALYAGLDSRGPQILQYRALAGFDHRQFATMSIDAPVFELDMVYEPTENDTFSLTGFRSQQNPTTPFALNQVVTQARLQYDHQLLADVFLRADASYGESQETAFAAGSPGEHQNQTNFGAAVFWNINRSMRGSVSYGHSEGTSSGFANTVLPAGFSRFNSNQIVIGITFFE